MIKLKLPLILASGSPRRKQLLASLGIEFEVNQYPFIETYPKGLSPKKVPLFLADQKSDQIEAPKQNTIYLTSDTVVFSEGKVLGKPTTQQEAIEMIQSYSEKSHDVISGVCLRWNDQKHLFSETTSVSFFPLSLIEIEHYVNNAKPFDKAGAYGIQEWMGLSSVKSIDGNFENVMGLPCARLYQELKKIDLIETLL